MHDFWAGAHELYGDIRLSLNSVDAGSGSNFSEDNNASRLGVKGSYDFGNGTSALYHVEVGLNADTGTAGDVITRRFAFAGLKGGFGTALYGTLSSPYKMAGLKVDPFYDTSAGTGFAGDNFGLSPYTNGWLDNVLAYITPTVGGVHANAVMVHGEKHTIMRNQDQKATVNPDFAKTSRKCPPFCIQPVTLAPGVETIGEVEMLHYLKKMSDGDNSVIVIDSRTPDWVERGTIPGSINIPWTKLNPAKGADTITIMEILEKHLNVTESEGLLDFSKARTAVMFCNGMWCGQSPTNIKTLLKLGYPADKIKWYRGGMQDWEILGLSTVKKK